MCAGMIDLKKAMTRIMELEEELKATREDYEEEIVVLVEKNDDLERKLGVFLGDPRTRRRRRRTQGDSPGGLHYHRRHRLGPRR